MMRKILIVILLFNIFCCTKNDNTIIVTDEEKGPDSKKLINELFDILENTQENYSIYIYDLKRHLELGINETEVFYPASICKLPYAMLVLLDIDAGVYTLEDTFPLKESNIAYSFDYMANLPIGAEYSIDFYLTNLIVKSDNTAMMSFEDFIGGLKTVNNRFKTELGIINFFRDPHTTTAEEVGKLLIQLYNHTLLSDESSEYLINLMKNTSPDHQDRIPAGLPEEIECAHKIGQLSFPEGLVYEDAGIIYGKSTDYVLVILNREVTKNGAIETITAISEAVYNQLDN